MNQRASKEQVQGERPSAKKKRRRRRRSVIGTILKVLGTILLVGVATGVLLVGFAAEYIRTVIIPDAQAWAQSFSTGEISLALTSTMYYTDENGVDQPYLTLSSEENRVWVEYKDIPQNMVKALVAIEDKRFWEHKGVDWIRTGRGVLNMFTGKSIQGGSTITQQLIKNSTGEDDVTVKRKITEIFRALEFEKNHSKEQILEWYLNMIYLGERCYGIGAASWAYFGKDVRELSLAQCASLVGITNNPSRYDPYLNKSTEVTNDAANRKRAKLVLWNMLDQGLIEEKEYDRACSEVDTMVFISGSPEGGESEAVYNWYQDQVITDVINDLKEKYGWSQQVAANKVYYGGLSIYTNLDMRVQEIVDKVYADPENLPYISKSGQQMQSAITILDSQGRVVALSGGIGEKKDNRGWSRAYHTKRPPGSSIKPLAVYGPALEMNLITPNSVIDDSPYQMMGGSIWPGNAVGYYKGLDTVTHAVAQSSNTVAVRVLGDYVTVPVSYNFLENKFHISSLVREKWINNLKYSDMDLSPLALGGMTNGVSTYEMAAAYSSFANMGRYVKPRTYSRVVDSDGETVLLDSSEGVEYIIKESTAYYMNNLLKEVVASGTARDAAFNGMTIAGKTGTTTAQKDLWFVGYTPYYTAAVWVGYDRQERLGNIGHPQNKLWKTVMSQIHEGLENKDFPLPSDRKVVTASYCLDSGMRPTELCRADVRGSRVATGVYLQGDEPTESCTLHQPVQVCTADPIINEETGETSGYHLAGEFCPEEGIQTMSAVNFVREGVAALANVRDGFVMMDKFTTGELCRVHDESWLPPAAEFDPNNPETWPKDDPNFNIFDPSTWPGNEPVAPGDEPVTPSHPPEETETPTVEPTPVVEPQPPAPPETSEGPVLEPPTLPEETYVPAGIPTE